MGRIRRALGVQKPKNKDPAVIHALRSSIDHPDPATRRDSLDPEMMAAILASTQESRSAPPAPLEHMQQASPHLSRAFSQANPQLAQEVREHRSAMLRQTPNGVHFFDGPVAEASALVLPSFEGSTKLRNMVLAQLENRHIQQEAEKEGIINRPAIRPFSSHQIVLNTAGDGNCLSHACSLGIWGVHDHDRLLRRALMGTFQSPKAGVELRQRFECQLASQGLPAENWASEWQSEVAALQHAHGFSDKFLADIHCFTLANVLRHPIIIYGDKMAAMSGLAGIYLPLLWDDPAGVCSRQPVTVLYHSNHFSLVAVVEGEGPTTPPLIPLSTSDSLLPVRFLLPHEQGPDGSFPSDLIGQFLDIEPMREGGWGIRLSADPAPNSLFALLEGAFIREMAASGGVPIADIPCAWAGDSPSCRYKPSGISMAPIPSHMGQPGVTPPPHPYSHRSPPPQQQNLHDAAPYPTHSPAAPMDNGYPPANPLAMPPPALAASMRSASDSRSVSLSRASTASSGSSVSVASPFAHQGSQEWAVPRNGTRLEPPTGSFQGLSLQSQGPPLHAQAYQLQSGPMPMDHQSSLGKYSPQQSSLSHYSPQQGYTGPGYGLQNSAQQHPGQQQAIHHPAVGSAASGQSLSLPPTVV